MRILLTGVAGFIGMHTAIRLIEDGHQVIGIDNLNSYYDVSLKQARLEHIGRSQAFSFTRADLADRQAVEDIFASSQPETVINLAAQAGVRYSLEDPHSYIESNITGFTHILEGCRHYDVQNLVYASSSSVYGLNGEMPFSEQSPANHPVALYGATKKANEVLAHSYSHLFDLPTTGLRFFTVYGPWGRPDMALFSFTRDILEGRPIDIYNHGNMMRDFTYIDDIVEGVVQTAYHPARPDPDFDPLRPDSGTSSAPWRIFNIGNGQPVQLMDYITALETALGIEAKKNFMPIQPGDVPATWADTSRLDSWVGFKPDTPVTDGVARFVDWYRTYYQRTC